MFKNFQENVNILDEEMGDFWREMETQEPMEILELKKFNRRFNSRREDQ